MNNKCVLKQDVLGRFPELEIDHERFVRLKGAWSVLSHALAIEEKYEIVISNFLELECEAAKLSISELVRNDVKYKDFFDVQLALNLRLVNFLSSVRLYTDQLASHVSKCSQSDDSIKETIKKLISKEYDLCFEYRFMEALRNHVQHRDIPVHCVSRNSRRVGTDDWLIESSLHFGAKKRNIAS